MLIYRQQTLCRYRAFKKNKFYNSLSHAIGILAKELKKTGWEISNFQLPFSVTEVHQFIGLNVVGSSRHGHNVDAQVRTRTRSEKG